MRCVLPLIVLVLPGFAPAPAPKPDPSARDLECLQGTWELVEEIYEGSSEPHRAGIQVTIVRDRFTFVCNGKTSDSYFMRVNARSKPKSIALTGRISGIATVAIYSLDGDTLTFCWLRGLEPTPPPDLSGKGPNAWKMVFKRSKR